VNTLGRVPVRGLAEPVDVFEFVGASAVRRRLQAAVALGLTPFVGRDQELAALRQTLTQARAEHGHLVAIVGEAGMGKSRLVYEVVHCHRTQGRLILESASVSYGKAMPYFPVIDLVKRYCHVEERDDPRAIRAKVTGQVLSLDERLHETTRRCSPCWTPCRWIARSCHSTPTAPTTHPGRLQGRAAAGEPGTILAVDLRGSALVRRRVPGAARPSRRQPAQGSDPAAGQLSARVSAGLW
jgi:AAA ATPase domain